jgi:hypothetical protein
LLLLLLQPILIHKMILKNQFVAFKKTHKIAQSLIEGLLSTTASQAGRAPFGIRRGCNKVYATSDAKVYRGCCLRVYTQNIMSS